MGLLSWFTTSEKAVDTGLDLVKSAASGIDVLFFTDEEKSQAAAKTLDMWLAYQKMSQAQGSARSLTRRYLACYWFMVFGTTFMLAIGFACAGDVGTVKRIIDVVAAFYAAQIMLSIVVFYFGPHMLAYLGIGKKK